MPLSAKCRKYYPECKEIKKQEYKPSGITESIKGDSDHKKINSPYNNLGFIPL
jgi:hypothetical protein